jgi:hypothetical protein
MPISRKEWFERHLLPIFKTRSPHVHITYDIFGNKSRNEKGFDHRTKSTALREKAGDLHAKEMEALNSEGQGDFFSKTEAVYDSFLEFIELEDAVSPHKTSWVRKYKKLDYDEIKKVLPDFMEIEFKSWSSRPEPDENERMLILKFRYREAYEAYRKTGSPEKLIDWDGEQKMFYKLCREKVTA